MHHQGTPGTAPERIADNHLRGERWHPAPVRRPDDLAGIDDAVAEAALGRRSRGASRTPEEQRFLADMERLRGRPLTEQEQNLGIAQAEMVGNL